MLLVLLLMLIYINSTTLQAKEDWNIDNHGTPVIQSSESQDKISSQEIIFCTISGKVTDQYSGIEIPGVVVKISGGGKDNETKTDMLGRYSLKMVKPGEYTIYFYPNQLSYPDFLNQKINIKAGEHIVLNKKIKSGGSIKGRVLKADGSPLKGIRVIVKCPDPIDREVYVINLLTTFTKVDGKYFFGSVFPSDDHNKYCVIANPDIPGFPLKVQRDIIVENGKETIVNDIIFDFNDVTGIEGYVTSANDRRPLANAGISITKELDKLNNQFYFVADLSTDTSGYFYFRNLEPGSYRISALPPVPPKKDAVTGKLIFDRSKLESYIVEKDAIVVKDKRSREDIKLNIQEYSKTIKTKVEIRLKYGKNLDKKPNMITLFGFGTNTDIKISRDRFKYQIPGIIPGEYQFRLSFLENVKGEEMEKTYKTSRWKEGDNIIVIPWDYIVIIDLFLSSKKVAGKRKSGWMQNSIIDLDITEVLKNRKEKTFYYKIEAIRKLYEK